MNNKKQNNGKSTRSLSNARRTALRGLALGGLASQGWIKPVVDSVILPAHAATSTEPDYFADITDRAPLQGVTSAYLCVTVAGGQYIGTLAMSFEDGTTYLFSNPATPLGEISVMTSACSDGGPFFATNASETQIEVAFSENGMFPIPAGVCNLPAEQCTAGGGLAAGATAATRASSW